jgi:signal transduction histidine kinase
MNHMLHATVSTLAAADTTATAGTSGSFWVFGACLIVLGAVLGTWWQWRRARQQLAQVLARQHAEHDALLRLYDNRLAQTAHELRTPLASIATALELIQQGYATTPSEVEECLQQARLAAHHLGFLVDDVLDVAAAGAGQLRLRPQAHALDGLLRSGERLLGLQARDRGLQLEFAYPQPSPMVLTDERRFLQVLFNLVGNALKFTEPGQSVRVEARTEGDCVRIDVRDHGPGVPRTLRQRLFQPFAGAEVDAARHTPSTGLGLHVCAVLVGQLGGRIGYEPGEIRGSVFWFELPLASGEHSELAIAPASAP